MSYTECRFTINPFKPYNEIVVAQLAEYNFESFTENENETTLSAFIVDEEFTKTVKEYCENLAYEGVEMSFEAIKIAKENWNKQWEESFDPVTIDDFCIIRAPFHAVKKGFKHEIIIEPKMSFGTGHHATTQMMVKAMSTIDFAGKSVLDMGSGTGVLAILADQLGAKPIDAIDIEEWAFENIQENIDRNDAPNVKPYLGDATMLNTIKLKYEVILANINKNILLADMKVYDSKLMSGGDLFLSGFFTYDAEDLIECLSNLNYSLKKKGSIEDWCCLHFIKA